MRTALIGLIIMQITLVSDSVAPGTVWTALLDGRHFPIWWTSAQFLNFLNFTIWRLFLNLTLKAAIFKFILARFDPH